MIKELVLCLALTGCATTKPSDIVPVQQIRIDPRILELCKDLVPLNTTATYEDVINNTIYLAEAYLDCRKRQEASVELLRTFANIKDVK